MAHNPFYSTAIVFVCSLDCSFLLDNMFHCSRLWGVQIDLVFSQNLENGPKLQPPLSLRYTMSGTETDSVSTWGSSDKIGFTQWMTTCTIKWNNGKMKQRDHSLKVSVLFEIRERLEDHGSRFHSQNTGRVRCVGKDTACSYDDKKRTLFTQTGQVHIGDITWKMKIIHGVPLHLYSDHY